MQLKQTSFFLVNFTNPTYTGILHQMSLRRGSQGCVTHAKQPNIIFYMKNDDPSKRPCHQNCWHWNQWSWPFMWRIQDLLLYFKQWHDPWSGTCQRCYLFLFSSIMLAVHNAITINIVINCFCSHHHLFSILAPVLSTQTFAGANIGHMKGGDCVGSLLGYS